MCCCHVADTSRNPDYFSGNGISGQTQVCCVHAVQQCIGQLNKPVVTKSNFWWHHDQHPAHKAIYAWLLGAVIAATESSGVSQATTGSVWKQLQSLLRTVLQPHAHLWAADIHRTDLVAFMQKQEAQFKAAELEFHQQQLQQVSEEQRQAEELIQNSLDSGGVLFLLIQS